MAIKLITATLCAWLAAFIIMALAGCATTQATPEQAYVNCLLSQPHGTTPEYWGAWCGRLVYRGKE